MFLIVRWIERDNVLFCLSDLLKGGYRAVEDNEVESLVGLYLEVRSSLLFHGRHVLVRFAWL